MRKAMGLLKDMSLEDKLRWQEEDRLKAISDEKAWAYDQGMKKGKQENLRQIVYRMLKEGADLITIEKFTGLSKTEIQKLQKK